MLTLLNKIKDKRKNNELVSVTNSGLKDLKEKIKKMSEAEKKLKTQNRQYILLKRFLSLINKINKEKV